MMQQLGPTILQMCGEVVKEAALIGIRNKLAPPPLTAGTETRGEAPARPEGCPYCAASKHLAVTHLYLSRADTHPGTAGIYRELARQQVSDAMEVLDRMPGAADVATVQLGREITKLEIALSNPTTANYSRLADAAWHIGDLAMDLAERFNAGSERTEQLVQRLEAQAAAVEVPTQVIEGEARVLD